MKRKKLIGGLAAFLLCAVVIGFNLGTAAYTGDDSGKSPEELLAELPEIAVTGTDLAIGEALLALPEVRAPAEAGAAVVYDGAAAAEVIGDLLPPDAASLSFSGIGGGPVLLSYFQGEKKMTLMQFEREESVPPYKLIAFYQIGGPEHPIRTVLYENLGDGTIQKRVVQRDWLYFLKG